MSPRGRSKSMMMKKKKMDWETEIELRSRWRSKKMSRDGGVVPSSSTFSPVEPVKKRVW